MITIAKTSIEPLRRYYQNPELETVIVTRLTNLFRLSDEDHGLTIREFCYNAGKNLLAAMVFVFPAGNTKMLQAFGDCVLIRKGDCPVCGGVMIEDAGGTEMNYPAGELDPPYATGTVNYKCEHCDHEEHENL
jgi:hypothetical protein